MAGHDAESERDSLYSSGMAKLPRPPSLFTNIETFADAITDHINQHAEALADGSWKDLVELKDLEKLGVLDGLNAERQKKLARLIVRQCNVEAVIAWTKERRDFRKRWRKFGPAYIRMAERKAEKVKSAIRDLRDYRKWLGVQVDASHTSERAFEWVLAVVNPHAFAETRHALRMLPKDRGTRTDVMARLERFFMNECGIKNKSEVHARAVTIGNHYWDWGLAVERKYGDKGQKVKGSPAMRQRMKRHHARRGTARKKT